MNPSTTALTDDEQWRAVVRKDAAFDGRFVYAVRTTGVYCRPSCPARPALRRNVVFHPSAAAAEAAGFRACKRCGAGRREVRDQAIIRACRMIEEAGREPGLARLAAAAGMAPAHFHRRFKAATGVTPKAYAVALRARRVRAELAEGGSVTAAIYGAGFNSNGRFYAKSQELLGMTPTSYRAGGAGERIRFAIGACSLGAVLVAMSAKGVCAIAIGDDPRVLARELQDQFPRADLVGGDEGFERTVARVIGFIEARETGIGLPLDIRGTAFQVRVWQALSAIPRGATATYAGIARRIGAATAVRAVAGACAANRIAVAIPCHRVVRTDGALSGYRWGVGRKRILLDREAAT